MANTVGVFDSELWWEIALLIAIMVMGHWLEMRAIGQARGALAALAIGSRVGCHTSLHDRAPGRIRGSGGGAERTRTSDLLRVDQRRRVQPHPPRSTKPALNSGDTPLRSSAVQPDAHELAVNRAVNSHVVRGPSHWLSRCGCSPHVRRAAGAPVVDQRQPEPGEAIGATRREHRAASDADRRDHPDRERGRSGARLERSSRDGGVLLARPDAEADHWLAIR